MGSPELPGDSGDGFHSYPIHIINQEGNNSDESDGEEGNEYEGYQPLPVTDLGDDNSDTLDNSLMEPVTFGDPSLPSVESVDAEVEREIWSQPRPQELQMELDNQRNEQIMSAMAGITLPDVAIPDWARGVPEERWKEDLLERIRQSKEISSSKNTFSRRTS